jgi:hypothetical protein
LPKKHLYSPIIRPDAIPCYGVRYHGVILWTVTLTSCYDVLQWHHVRSLTLVSIYMLQWDRVICHNDSMLWDMSRCVHVMKYVAMTECYGVAHNYTVLWRKLRNFKMTSLYVTTKSTVCGIVL